MSDTDGPAAGSAPPVRVSPGGLRRSGREMQRIAREVADDLSTRGSMLAPDDPGSDGWAVGAAARSAAKAWAELVHRTGDRLEGAGKGMVAAAHAYQHSDERAASRTGGVIST